MNDDSPMQGRFDNTDEPRLISEEGLLTISLDPLALNIPDEDLVDNYDKLLREERKFYKGKDLYERRKKNEVMVFGRHIAEKLKERQLKDWESTFQDNVLYEIEATIKPLAMSRLPDLIITPGNDSQEAQLMAEELSKAVDTQIKTRQNRRILGVAFKHLPVYFTAVLKVRWNPEIDDYVFEVIHPDLIDVDFTSPTNNADDMKWVSQIVPLTIDEVTMRFPKAKEKFYTELAKDGIDIKDNNPTWKQLATEVKIREIWFTDYVKHSNTEWERVEGVMWKYKDCILAKMKNPNFDYTGETQYFTYDMNGEKLELTEELKMQAMLMGVLPPDTKEEQVYHNYFDRPRKPYFFFGYDQWNTQPYDETSRIEQNIPNQEAINKRGKQIEETLDNRGHHIWSKESGLKPDDIENIDMSDPDEDVVVDGIPSQVHDFIPPDRPTADEFQDLNAITQRMYGIAGANAVRGEVQSDTATSNQIARESDFTRADDLVEDTINAAAEWLAQWSLQMIKLRYTEDHFRKLLGVAGKVVFLKLNQNMVDDGMEVMIKASGTDKLKAQNNAMDMAKMQMTDPLSFFRDMGYQDAEQRAEMLMMMKLDPPGYLIRFVNNLKTSEDMAAALSGMPPMNNPMQQPGVPPVMGGEPPPPGAGGIPQNPMPQQPTPDNTAAVPVVPPVGAPQGSPRVM